MPYIVQVAEEDVQRLRAHGFSDREVLDIVHVASYFAYVNRIARRPERISLKGQGEALWQSFVRPSTRDAPPCYHQLSGAPPGARGSLFDRWKLNMVNPQ